MEPQWTWTSDINFHFPVKVTYWALLETLLLVLHEQDTDKVIWGLKPAISSRFRRFLVLFSVMSLSPEVSLDVFPAWARLNDVDFTNAKLQETKGKGFGLVAVKDLNDKVEEKENGNEGETKDGKDPRVPTTTTTKPTKLLHIPQDLVLSADSVKGYANVDQNFRQLFDAAGHQVKTDTILPQLLLSN